MSPMSALRRCARLPVPVAVLAAGLGLGAYAAAQNPTIHYQERVPYSSMQADGTVTGLTATPAAAAAPAWTVSIGKLAIARGAVALADETSGFESRLADVTLAFPTLLLLIAVAAAVNPSLPVVFVVIGVVGWAAMARLVRGQVLALKGSEYVLAARALGAPDRRILFRHLLPNVRAQVIVAATLGMAGAIMAEAALSFVGLGAQPPTPSWGSMVADGRDLLRVAPWVSFAPGIAIGLAVLGFNLVGDTLREAFDPKLRTER